MNIGLITIVISCLTLVVTVLGWTVTYNNQRKLLNLQLTANKENAKMQFSIPHKLEQIKLIRDWISEGRKILYLINEVDDPAAEDALRKRLKGWNTSLLTEIYPLSALLDPPAPAIEKIFQGKKYIDSLDLLLMKFSYHIIQQSSIKLDNFPPDELEEHQAFEDEEKLMELLRILETEILETDQSRGV